MVNCSTNTLIYQSAESSISSGVVALSCILGLLIGFILGFLLLWILFFHYMFDQRHLKKFCLANVYWSRAEKCCHRKAIPKLMVCLRRKNTAVSSENEPLAHRGANSASSSVGSPSPSRRPHSTNQPMNAEGGGGDSLDSVDQLANFCLVSAVNLPLPDSGEEAKLCLFDAISKNNEYAGEHELLQQDLAATEQLERRLIQQRLMGFAQLCWILLNKLTSEEKLDTEACEQMQQQLLARLNDLKWKWDLGFNQVVEQVQKDKKLTQQQQQSQLSQQASHYAAQAAESLNSELEQLAHRAGSAADLPEQEMDSLLWRMKAAAAQLERSLAQSRLRQCAQLEEALARRRLLVAEQASASEAVEFDAELQLQCMAEQLQGLAEDKTIGDCDKYLAAYRRDLVRHRAKFQLAFQEQQQQLQRRLQKLRKEEADEVEERLGSELQQLVQSVEAGTLTDPQVFLQRYSAVLDQAIDTRQEMMERLDERECNQLALLRDDLAQVKRSDELASTEAMNAQLKLEESDWGRVLDLHLRSLTKTRKRRQLEQRQQLEQLEKKLLSRQSKLTESLLSQESELESVSKKQQVILQKSLTFQLDMDDAAKKRILDERDRSMLALGNKLQVSRLKQEKLLEARISERKARIAEVRHESRAAQLEAQEQRQRERLSAELQRQEQQLRQELEAESRRGRQLLQEAVAEETETALQSQEQQLSVVIGKLQTGQARRRRIIDKQQLVLNELQQQLEAKLAAGEKSANSMEVEQILSSHRNQVASLEDQMQREKSQQEQLLTARLQRRQTEREEEVKEQLHVQEQTAARALNDSGHGKQGAIAQFALELQLDSQFRNSMLEMEEQMRMELRRQQEELDREMEQDLQAAVEDQRKHLLSQLAKVTKIRKSEMQQMVQQAADATGASKKLSRQISAELSESSAAAAAAAPSSGGAGSNRMRRRGSDFDFS